MSSSNKPSMLRSILWPVVITTAVSVVRLVAELNGMVTNESGGGGAWLGITWLAPLFGAWFGYTIARRGDQPRLRPPALWFFAAFAAVIATFAWLAKDMDPGDASEAGRQMLRSIVHTVAIVAVVAASLALLIWPRLGLTLLAYGLAARLGVMAITYVAKVQGWTTHYTKLGPAGIETDLAETMLATSVAQFGLWVPFTVLAGGLFGSLAALLAGRK